MTTDTTKEASFQWDELGPHEIFWRDQSSFLMDHGYQLRPRYRLGWIPSWTGTNRDPIYFEDSHSLRHPKTIDAVRLHDNRDVYIKRVQKGSKEIDINVYLSKPNLRADPSNHTVPLLDLIHGNEEYDFIVMPLLRFFNNPPFVFIDEVLDFVQQSLEGLAFLHRVGIAHRDCSVLNIMFDATAMYPNGFHPSRQHVKRSGSGIVRDHLNRADVPSSIRYYFTDFGISSQFTNPSLPRLVTGRHCQDKTVPELSDDKPYDPFRTDVYILGNVYQTRLTDKYTNLSFLKPLVFEMTKMGPRTRPSAKESLSIFHDMVRQQRQIGLRWMLMEPNLTRSKLVSLHLHSLIREIRRLAKRLLGLHASVIIFAALAIVSLVYGPRNTISRIRERFGRRRL